MIGPNCQFVKVGMIDNQVVVVVQFDNSFSVWIPIDADIRFEDGLTCEDLLGDDDDDGGDD